MAQTVKNLPAMLETQIRSLDREDPLEKGIQPTPVILPGTGEPGGLHSPLDPKELEMSEQLSLHY